MIKHIKRHAAKMKHNRHHELLIAFIVALFFSTNILVPYVSATSLLNAKDTLSTSAPNASAVHTVTFTTNSALNNGDKMRIVFPLEFTGMLAINMDCPPNSNESVSGQDALCTATGLIGAGAQSISVGAVTNPATSTSYLLTIRTEDSAGNILEQSDVRVSVNPTVVMTASVSATLLFTISGTSTGAVVNGITSNATSTATSTPFGNLNVGATSTVAQELAVTSNAGNGYIVTVEQDHELSNTTGSTINSFNNSADDTGSTTPQVWTAPLGILDQTQTYGHMGLTTGDADLGGGWGADLFAGLNGSSTMQIMSHTGPSDGATLNKGRASVLYAIAISALQEAGDYTNTLTYICTPTY